LEISGLAGVNLIIGKLELFIQAMPRLELVKATKFEMGGGAGFRIYF
jgi:hypothetical protein